ncbi:hypothetical protein A3D77_04010 [Candidatus Gottesmanbacteria bacterium RIFCSPHIGHO2_02_FULL_39_11]|uniref:Hydrogenase assembly protein HypC n=1 Tax=Candidatus Gottesmanbacteria bacterium RIFCSPHIGHO2_02_FULL_39_11 TaxID=1798382 RepID=A0A1F5ZJX2_9BACT|nr:MAG: hypothetical protein A3D77_04010 [Candidatus Gottesmanbacteria bacterium RIFCSPHIGHO2_02_FULL_39_11]
MCFSIPAKIIAINGSSALIEGGKSVKIGKDLKVKKGEYLRVVGSVAVEKLSKTEGLKIRKLLKSLNN